MSAEEQPDGFLSQTEVSNVKNLMTAADAILVKCPDERLNLYARDFQKSFTDTDSCTIHVFVALILIYPVSSLLLTFFLDYQSGFKVKGKRDPLGFTWSVCF